MTPDRVTPGAAPPGRAVRREQLLDAAEQVVARDGPATSMAAVAACAGITKPVLYRHFTDKSGLRAALVERHTARLMTTLQAELAGSRGRRERVERTVGAYLGVIEQQPQLYRFLLEPAGGDGVRGFTRQVAGVLAAGLARELGTGPPGPRESAWAHGIVGMVQAAGDWWLVAQPCPREQVAADLADLVLGGYASAGFPAGHDETRAAP